MYQPTSSNKCLFSQKINPIFKLTLNKIMEIGQTQFELNNYNYIPTVAFRNEIALKSKDIRKKCGFDKFAILIIYNQQFYWLSNTYNDLAIPHDIYKLGNLDLASAEAIYTNKNHFFPIFDIASPVYELFSNIVQNFYHFYVIYTLVRISSECRIVLFSGNSHPVGNLNTHQEIYNKTYKDFEIFCANFLDSCMEYLLIYNASIKYARIFYDTAHRRSLIKGNYSEHTQILSNKEAYCLHWASLGKTAEEAAIILKISPYTVRQHLKDAIQKLQSNNITNAVYKAKCLNLI